MMRLCGYNPTMQFIHEDDIVEIIIRLIMHPQPGTFNVAADGVIKYTEIARLARKKMLVLPEILVRTVLRVTWNLHLQDQSPVTGLEFIKYPPVVDTTDLKNILKYHFKYSTTEAVSSYLRA